MMLDLLANSPHSLKLCVDRVEEVTVYIPEVGKLFTRRARFGKTVEAAGRTLIGKPGEDLFFFILEFTVHVRM